MTASPITAGAAALLAQAPEEPTAGSAQLVVVALLGIAVVVLMISWLQLVAVGVRVATGSATVATNGQTIKTWSVMETIISVVGLSLVLLLSVVV